MKHLIVAAVLVAGAAQQPPAFDPDAIPVEQEPQHHLVFANEFVRVIDLHMPPGFRSLKHSHVWDNVAVTIDPGRNDPEALARVGRVTFQKGGYSHAVGNTAPLEAHFLDIEILTSGAKANETRELAAHKLELENDKVRVYRVTLAPGQSMVGHSHGHGWLSVTVKGGPPGAFTWHDALSSDAMKNSGTSPLEMVEIEPK
jgi:acetolactate synthase regulatory subunit